VARSLGRRRMNAITPPALRTKRITFRETAARVHDVDQGIVGQGRARRAPPTAGSAFVPVASSVL
jgi:hypothetical protein